MAPRRPSTTEIAGLLRKVPIFANCSKREIAGLSRIVKRVRYPAGTAIAREGESGIGLHVIVEGHAKVQVRGRTRARVGPGDFFGEIALLDGGPRTAAVVAETPVETLSMPVWHFKSALREHPAMALRMLEEVCGRLRRATASIHD